MNIYAIGLDPAWIASLRAHQYDVVGCRVIPDDLGSGGALLVTSEERSIHELSTLRESYPDNEIMYMWMERGIAGWQTPAAVCEANRIRFIRPGIGIQSFIEQLDTWYRVSETLSKLIGVFGTMPGVGVTRIASTVASLVAAQKKVVMLGLNVYNGGWEKERAVSLDQWRQRMAARVLQPEDMTHLVKVGDFRYLPGNEDLLAVHDYGEHEIEHLLQVAQTEADIVVADFGSIPESAAWFCGMQQSAIRIMVTHPDHTRRLPALMKLSSDIGVSPEHWFVASNRAGTEDVSLKTIAQAQGMQPLFSLPYKGHVTDFMLPYTDREKESIQKACQPLFTAIGMEQPKKRGWL